MYGGGLMDPDVMRLAQEQMSRLRPEDLRRMQQQMMSNPDLFRMASESMKNLRPEDIRMAADQMKQMPAEQMVDISERMAKATPEELANMKARTEAFKKYEFQGSMTLKEQGNELHSSGRYSEAAEKYSRAKDNLVGMSSGEAKKLRLACSLNLMSCYLKTNQPKEVVAEGSEVLQVDPGNLKALYRRGQAYKEMGKYKLAVEDLKRAAELSPDDGTIADVLRQAESDLEFYEPVEVLRDGPLIEEITDEEAERFSSSSQPSERRSNEPECANAGGLNREAEDAATSHVEPSAINDQNFAETMSALRENPEMIRNAYTMMSNLNPEHIAELSGGGLSPEMAKLAADMVKQMSPDELQRMVEMASVGGREGGSASRSWPDSRPNGVTNAVHPASVSVPDSRSSISEISAEAGPSQRFNSSGPVSSTPDISGNMEEHLRKQMKNPAMMQMMASMMKSMTPEMMSNMSEQLGIKLSAEEARQAQKAMSSFSPDEIDKLMRWAERAQRLGEQGKRVKNWLLGRPGLVLAVLMLLVAVILHYFGVIGS